MLFRSSPGKNTGVGCHFLLQCRKVKSEREVAQSCPTLCDPRDGSPTRLRRPWDSPGKNTGVGCHFLLQCMKVKSESDVAQSCPTLATPWTAAYQAPPSMGFSRQKWQMCVSFLFSSSVYSCAYIFMHLCKHTRKIKSYMNLLK